MKLPVLFAELPGQNFECRACTRCCRELVVHLTPIDVAKIDRHKWIGRIEGEPYIRVGNSKVLNHKPGGGCVFLLDDGRCRIHAEFGLTEKPLACQLYPFTLEASVDAVHVGVRFDCPTTAASGGLPLVTHKREVKRLAEELDAQSALTPASEGIEIVRGAFVPTATADNLTENLKRWLRDESLPLRHRLGGILKLAATLAAAKYHRIGREGTAELLDMLGAGVRELAEEEEGSQLGTPTPRELRLFRQTVFSHCESITLQQMLAPLIPALRFRWDQLKRARQMTAGNGTLPPLRPIGAPAAFEQIDRIGFSDGTSANANPALIVRYLLARLEGRSVFGAGYYGWTIVDGLNALLLSVACAGWLARCVAASDGRDTFATADLERAVGIVDRAAGRVPELGAKSARLRVGYLADDGGIARLLARYSVTERTV